MRRHRLWVTMVIAALLLAGARPAGAQVSPRAEASAADGGGSGASEPTWRLLLAAGGGIGTRDLDLPRDGVVYQTRTGVFPAVDLGFALEHDLTRAWVLGVYARYQTSIGLRISEQHTGGQTRMQHLRSHRLELAVAPSWRFGGVGEGSSRVSLRVGYGLCDLRPEVHLETPGYGLGGPFARAELQVALGTPRVRVRLGPEAQWIVQVGKELAHDGFATSGFAIGGAAALEVSLGKGWIVDATLSELHAWLGSAQRESLRDASRFITARLSGTL